MFHFYYRSIAIAELISRLIDSSMYCYSLIFLLPQRDPENLKAQKWTGHYVGKKKKQVSVLALRTDLRTRPVNGLIYIRQPHVHHHEHPQLFSNFAEQIANHLFPPSRRTFILKKHQTLGDLNAQKKRKRSYSALAQLQKKLRGADECF